MTLSKTQKAVRHAAVALLGCALAPSVYAQDYSSLVGQWKIRIDGGGEIYTSYLELEPSDDGESLTGKYEADGRKGRVQSVAREPGYYVVEVATRRSGMAARGLFMFELVEGVLDGEVDFEVGTSVRSYEFQAERMPGGNSRPSAGEKAREGTSKVNAKTGEAPAAASDKRSGTVSFSNGEGGYTRTIDTEIWAIAPSKALDRQGTMTADGNNGGGESQVLMRFAELFGDSEDQAPVGSRIVSAKLSIVVFDPGSTVYLHRVLAPWRESATWDGMAAA